MKIYERIKIIHKLSKFVKIFWIRPLLNYQRSIIMSCKHTERTYIMVKPDGVQRGLVGEIIKRFEARGFQLLAAKFQQASSELLAKHYESLAEKPFFPGLVAFMSSGPVMCLVFGGKDVVRTARKMLGETNPLASAPGTIRGDFCIDVGRNICHGSDSVETAEREIALWFPEGVVAYERPINCCIYE